MTTITPAQHVIKKCGGIKAMAEITGRTQSNIHRWTYPKDRGGTGGFIPKPIEVMLLERAANGILDIGPSDFFPAPARASVSGSSQ